MNRRTSRFLVVGALVPAVPMLLGAGAALNSEQSKSPAQIIKDAVAATGHTRDFVVSGTINSSGTSMTLNLVMSAHGGGGSITIPKATMDIITAGKFAYIKANAASWVTLGIGSKQKASIVAGRWIRVPSSTSGFSNFAQLTYSNKFLQALFSTSPNFSKQRGAHQLHGHPVIVLSSPNDGSMDVAATGKPYILRVAAPAKASDSGALNFSRFNTASVPKAPAHYIALPGK